MRDLWREETRNMNFELQDSYDEEKENEQNQNWKNSFVHRWKMKDDSIDYDNRERYWCDFKISFSVIDN